MSERNDAIKAFCLSMFGAMLLIAIKEIYYSFQSQECDEEDLAGRAMDKGAGEAPDKLLEGSVDKDKASDASSDEAGDKDKEEEEDEAEDKDKDEAAEAAKKAKFDVWAEHTEPPDTDTVLTDGVMLGPCAEDVCPKVCGISPDEVTVVEEAGPDEEKVSPEGEAVEEAGPDEEGRAVEEPPLEQSACTEGVCPFMTEPSVRSAESVPYGDVARPDDAELYPCGECQQRPQTAPCDEGVCPSGSKTGSVEELTLYDDEQKPYDELSTCEVGVCPHSKGAELSPCEMGVCPYGDGMSWGGDIASTRSELVPCTDAVCVHRTDQLPCDVGVCPPLDGASPAVEVSAPTPATDFTPCAEGVCPYRSEISCRVEEPAPPLTAEAAPCTGDVCPHRTEQAPCDEAVCQHESKVCLPEEKVIPQIIEPVPCADNVCPRRPEEMPSDGIVCPVDPKVCPVQESVAPQIPDAASVGACSAAVAPEEKTVVPPPLATKGPCRDNVCPKRKKVVVPCAENVCPLTDHLSTHTAAVSPCEATCEDDPRLNQCQDNVCPHASRPIQSSPETKPKEG